MNNSQKLRKEARKGSLLVAPCDKQNGISGESTVS